MDDEKERSIFAMLQQNQPKVVLLGKAGSGKTSLILQLINGTFNLQTDATVGASYSPKKIKTDQGIVTLRVWDTAGEERYKSLVPMYLRGADSIIIVIDTTSLESYQEADSWIKLGQEICGDSKIYIAANKIDLQPVMSLKELKRWAESQGYVYFETTATDGSTVLPLFTKIAKDLISRRNLYIESIDSDPKKLSDSKSNFCC